MTITFVLLRTQGMLQVLELISLYIQILSSFSGELNCTEDTLASKTNQISVEIKNVSVQ